MTVKLTQWLSPLCLSLDSPTISSHTAAVLSKEQEARTWPNSGWAQVTLHTDPLCVCTGKITNVNSQQCFSCDRGEDIKNLGEFYNMLLFKRTGWITVQSEKSFDKKDQAGNFTFQLAVQCHSPVSLLSQTCGKQVYNVETIQNVFVAAMLLLKLSLARSNFQNRRLMRLVVTR